MKIKKYNRRLLFSYLVILISCVVLISGCKKDEETPGTNEVFMQNTAFTPSTITISTNTTITWTNKDGTNHTVTDDSLLFDSGNISDGNTFSFKYTSPGTFPYHCKLHSGMKGQVIVN